MSLRVRHKKIIIWTSEASVNIICFWSRTQIFHGTEGHMAVYGPVRDQKHIILTEASEVHIIIFL
jgi:hypothetical protein